MGPSSYILGIFPAVARVLLTLARCCAVLAFWPHNRLASRAVGAAHQVECLRVSWCWLGVLFPMVLCAFAATPLHDEEGSDQLDAVYAFMIIVRAVRLALRPVRSRLHILTEIPSLILHDVFLQAMSASRDTTTMLYLP